MTLWPLFPFWGVNLESMTNEVGHFQQATLIKWKLYIREGGWPVPSAISALPTKSNPCPLLPVPLPGTKLPAQWGPFSSRCFS